MWATWSGASALRRNEDRMIKYLAAYAAALVVMVALDMTWGSAGSVASAAAGKLALDHFAAG